MPLAIFTEKIHFAIFAVNFFCVSKFFFRNLAWKAPFGLIFYELRAKRRAESEFDSFRPCFWDKTYIFRNSTGKRPLELIFGEFFTARRTEYEFDIFESFSDFSASFFFAAFSRIFLSIFL